MPGNYKRIFILWNYEIQEISPKNAGIFYCPRKLNFQSKNFLTKWRDAEKRMYVYILLISILLYFIM